MHVIKIGGAVCKDDDVIARLADAWKHRPDNGDWMILHGGGPQLTTALADLGEAPRRVDGLRVTSRRAAEVVAKTLDDVGDALARRLHAAGVPVRRVRGDDERFAAVPKDHPTEDLGRVGTVTHFNGKDLPRGVLVVTPVGWDAEGPLNINADEGALAAATSVCAERLVLVTDVPAVRGSNGHGLPLLMPAEVELLLANGTARGGMVPKLRNALDALRLGVQEVAIGDLSLLADHRAGTRILPTPMLEATA